MKRNALYGIILISALALGSCSTQKLASNQGDDDVYNTNAKAGDAPEYIARNNTPAQDRYYNSAAYDDDYYYYDSYASRINRFGYYSPFSYYDNLYYGYSPYYYGGVGWNPYLGYGLGIGIGYGGYYGYSPYWGFGYGGFYDPLYYGYGYGGYYGYPYSYWGTGYGGGYWGIYSANNRSNIPRPSRLGAAPAGGIGAMRNSGGMVSGRSGSRIYPDFTPNRPSRIYGTDGSGNGRTITTNGRQTRTSTTNDQPQRPTYQPTERPSYNPPPSNSGGGGGGRSGGGGGGGGRPGRP